MTSTVPAAFRVVLIQPAGYEHAGALAELAETLLFGLAGLGLDIDFSINDLAEDRRNIILGAHLLTPEEGTLISPDAIIYNSEQVDDRSTWIDGGYLGLLKRQPLWDYSEANLERLATHGIEHGQLVPVGYVPQLTRIPQDLAQDIDVLFYGAINERRRVILEALIHRGLKVEFLSGIYREARDRMIARAKVVLNLHYYDANVFEIVRVSYLLTNEKAVVAECGDTTRIDDKMREAVCAVPYDKLVEACVDLVNDASKRTTLARRGFEIFSGCSEESILVQALHLPPPSPTVSALPLYLNLGSGKDWRENCLNVDISDTFRPDALLDIGKKLNDGQMLATHRFGTIELRQNMFDAIFANDVLEHIPDLVTAMENCLRLLKAGGTFHIYVPYDLSLGAWQDPTHIRAFNENSWLYFTDWYWYLGWTEARFDRLSTEFRLSAFGQTLQSENRPLEEILRTPRAVDGMHVILRKRHLLESEAARSLTAIQRPWDATGQP